MKGMNKEKQDVFIKLRVFFFLFLVRDCLNLNTNTSVVFLYDKSSENRF